MSHPTAHLLDPILVYGDHRVAAMSKDGNPENHENAENAENAENPRSPEPAVARICESGRDRRVQLFLRSIATYQSGRNGQSI